MDTTTLPKPLIDQLRSQNVILFLGAGASIGCISDNDTQIPKGQDLADLLAKEFLDDTYLGTSLQIVSELAISETSLRQV